MTPERFKNIRLEKGYSREQMGEFLRVSSRTIENWEQERRKIPAWVTIYLEEII